MKQAAVPTPATHWGKALLVRARLGFRAFRVPAQCAGKPCRKCLRTNPALAAGVCWRTFGSALLAVGLAPLALAATTRAAQSAQEAARQIVHAEAYASLEPVPRGRAFEVAVVAEIKPAYHINAHKVLDSYLIPTALDAPPAAGFRILSTEYPAGELRSFPFSKNKLAVYTGRVELRMKVAADAKAPLGSREFPLRLQYQACNNSMCLPPVHIPVTLRLTVAPAGAATQPIHLDLFPR